MASITNYFPSKKRLPLVSDSKMRTEMKSYDSDDSMQSEKAPKQYVYILPSHIETSWPKIKRKLIAIQNNQCDLKEVAESIEAIINFHYEERCRIDVQNLMIYFSMLPDERKNFFRTKLLPFIASTALEIEQGFSSIMLLLKNETSQMNFTKQQIAILISNMFFCTLHEQPNSQLMPQNFYCSLLFMKSIREENNILKREKLSFIFEYFMNLYNKTINLDLIVSFERYSYNNLKKTLRGAYLKDKGVHKMCSVKVDSETKIEEHDDGLQVCFSNKFIGGGVLSNGSLQEEIRFLISPEALVSLLLFEELEEQEVMIISGTQQISNYKGYSKSLEFAGPYNGPQPEIDQNTNMLKNQIAGIDSINFKDDNNKQEQFDLPAFMREIRKAFVAFSDSEEPLQKSVPRVRKVYTGNWGCGDFGGNKELKFIIQWIAASVAGVSTLSFHTHGDKLQEADIKEVFSILQGYNSQDIYGFVKEYFNECSKKEEFSLFQYIATFVN